MDVILFSGGMDSALLLARSPDAQALFVDYGQEARVRETEAACSICRALGAAPLRYEHTQVAPPIDDIYPARNALLVIAGVRLALAIHADAVLIGCNAGDAAHFPDCRPGFIGALDAACDAGYGVRVRAPLLGTPRASIATEYAKHNLPQPWSCYRGSPQPCGQCRSCKQGERA